MDKTTSTTLSPAEENFLAFQRDQLGSFDMALWTAITKADTYNLMKLKRGFQEEVDVWQKWAYKEGYAEDLKRREKKSLTRTVNSDKER